MPVSTIVRYFFGGSGATCFFRGSVASACYPLSRKELCVHNQNRCKSSAVEEKEVQVALSFFFSYHNMNNNDYFLIIFCVVCFRFFLGFFVVFFPLYSSLFPFLTLMIPSFVCHICWLVDILYLPESIWQHYRPVFGGLSSSFFDLLLWFFWNKWFLSLFHEFKLATQQKVLTYMTQAGLEQGINVSCVPFLLVWDSRPRWLLSLQLRELRKNKIKASTLKVVTQDQLMCNLTPLGVWTLQDLLAVLWPHQKTMGMLWSRVWGWTVMSSGHACYHTVEFQQMGSYRHTHAREVIRTNINRRCDG